MKALLHFLFGKPPQIFDENGEVRHQFPEEKWKAWDAKFRSSEYNWKNHKGRRAEIKRPQKSSE